MCTKMSTNYTGANGAQTYHHSQKFSSSSSQFSNILQYTIMWIISLACKFADTSACQWEWSRRSKIKLVINQDCSLMDTPNNWDGWYFERRKRSICVAKIHLAKDKVNSILVFLRNLVILFFNNCDYWIEKFWPTKLLWEILHTSMHLPLCLCTWRYGNIQPFRKSTPTRNRRIITGLRCPLRPRESSYKNWHYQSTVAAWSVQGHFLCGIPQTGMHLPLCLCDWRDGQHSPTV